MSAVADCFNECAQKLLEFHLSSGCRKIVLWLTNKFTRNQEAQMQEGTDLVAYPLIRSIAMRKILRKYDMVLATLLKLHFPSRKSWTCTICIYSCELIHLRMHHYRNWFLIHTPKKRCSFCRWKTQNFKVCLFYLYLIFI